MTIHHFSFLLILSFFLPGVALTQDSSGIRVLGRISNNWDDVNDVAIQDEYAFLAVGESGFAVIDVSDPDDLQVLVIYNTPGDAKGVAVVGDYAYVADYREGLRIIDITDPEDIDEVGSVDTPGRAHRVDVWGDYAYVADGPSGIRKIDISDKSNPWEQSRMDTPGDSRDIAVSSDYGYVADYGNGVIKVVLGAMFESESIETHHLAFGIVKRANTVYVADGYAGVTVFDNSLTERSSFNTSGSANGLAVLGDYVFVADGENGLRVINMSDFDNPYEVGSYDTPGDAKRIAMNGNIAYLADGDNFGIYECSGALDVIEDGQLLLPDQIIVNAAYPNPFNSTTTISYGLPVSGNVSLQMYNPSGRLIKTLFDGYKLSGIHATTLTANNLPSGLYFVQLNVSDQILTQKVMLIR